MKRETLSIKEEGSTVEDTCTVYVQGESMKMESTEQKSKKFIFFLNTVSWLFCGLFEELGEMCLLTLVLLLEQRC